MAVEPVSCPSLHSHSWQIIDGMSFWCQLVADLFRPQIDMSDFIGRARELREFREILKRRNASLVTCQGRRRIGKSRFIMEGGRGCNQLLTFVGLPPREGLSAQDQLEAFSIHLSRQTRAPKLPLADWPTAFQLLASQLDPGEKTIVLLDEISWMAIGDRDFAGHLKTAWDQEFSRIPGLTVVLCGSVSSWIEDNILNNTGFAGRCTWQFDLQPLPVSECAAFWGKRLERVSPKELWRMLAVTGGVPGYLEQLMPSRSAAVNIERLCFNSGGMLFHEFDRIFHETFNKRAETCEAIARALVSGPRTLQQIASSLERGRGGSLTGTLRDLELAGFIRKDRFFDPVTGKTRPRDHRFRLADNFLRFYLKYVEPVREQIEAGLYQRVPLESLEAWDTIMGLQFETLILGSLDRVFEELELGNRTILNAGPYAQNKTQRRQGCQIDLLIRSRQSLYLVEMKFRKKIRADAIDQVKEKIARLKLPRTQSVRTVLLHSGELESNVEASDYFDFVVSADQWIRP